MKKLTFIFPMIFFTLIHFTFFPAFAETSPPDITAPSGILIDGDTGDILYGKNAHELMYPASTTKILTAILTLENANLKDKVVIDKDTPFTGESSIYLSEGEELTVEQLLYALLIKSANDSAVALAKHISGNVENFATLMNKRAKELGAKNTHFVNPNGLPDNNHVTTAYDLAMLAKYAMTLPKFREITQTVRYEIPPTNKQPLSRYLKTSNRFLWGVGGRNKIFYKGNWVDIKYDIVEGIKTGYTNLAQQCLVTSANKDGHRLISVILKAEGTNVYLDSRTLIDYGFENFKFVKIIDAKEKIQSVSVKAGEEKELDLITQDKLYKTIPKDENLYPVKKVITLQNDITAPVKKGQQLGKVAFTYNNKILGEVSLIAAKSINKKEGITSIFYSNGGSKKSFVYYILFSLLIFLIWRSIVTIIRLKKRRKRLIKKNKLVHSSFKNSFLN